MADLGPTLTTERLILRPPRPEDFDSFAEMMADADGLTFIGGAQPKATAWRTFAGLVGGWVLNGYAMFCVFERDGGRFVGRIGPQQPWGWPGTEVGWGLVRSAWGKGYAHEAAVASMDWAVDRLGWSDIIHCIDPQNTPSIALARRLGSQNRGPGRMPPPVEDHRIDLWGQTAAEWRARRRA
jgi:RimJ/RimL family protein N-acetyltransferase